MPEITAELYTELMACRSARDELHRLRMKLDAEQRAMEDMFNVRPGEGIFETRDGLVRKARIPNGDGRRFPDRVMMHLRQNFRPPLRDTGYEFTNIDRSYREYRLERFFGHQQVPLYIET